MISHISLVLMIFLGILLIVICIYYFVGNSFFTPFIGLFQKSFVVKSNRYNKLATLDLSNKPLLQKIEIGNDCFGSVKTFRIDRLHRLKMIKIGINSFTQKKNSLGSDESKSFHILNCESLESIHIGEYSFSDYAGEFELKNLPKLQSIQIGTIGSYSNNFYRSSFVIRGIEMILNNVMIRSSKSTIHYIRWSCILWFLINSNRKYWMNLNEMIWIDLPSLQSITLGEWALRGSGGDSSSLTMRSTNEMIWNDWM